ncbi:MAG: GTPase RsgA [Clostridia bacterium]|jgi:ribosome biogenesis GTPase|nr:GTPase RsgA [Clostridia bacterium]
MLSQFVGDNVEFEEIEKGKAVINEILERKVCMKRPKVSNISQIVFVISPQMPKLNSLILDKELCYAEFMDIKQIIAINKVDLDEKEAERIYNIYKKSGFEVLEMQADINRGISELKRLLLNNTSAFAGESGVRKINNYK